MADRRVALLRGINVGKAKRVAMGDLRTLVEELGYGDVRTLLNSGNVVFTVPRTVRGAPAARIQDAITARLGVSSRVIVLAARELAEIVDGNPLLDIATDHSRLMVTVFADPKDRAGLEQLAMRAWLPDTLAIGTRAAYQWCPNGALESPVAIAVGRLLGDRATTRNWATVTKLRALL